MIIVMRRDSGDSEIKEVSSLLEALGLEFTYQRDLKGP